MLYLENVEENVLSEFNSVFASVLVHFGYMHVLFFRREMYIQ